MGMNLADRLAPLTQFALFLVLTLTLPRLMQRLRLPGPIGFILAGILLGPQVFGVLRPRGSNVTTNFRLQNSVNTPDCSSARLKHIIALRPAENAISLGEITRTRVTG